MENKMIREHAVERGVFLWEAALELGMSQSSMTRLLRMPVIDEKRDEIIAAIDRIADRKERD